MSAPPNNDNKDQLILNETNGTASARAAAATPGHVGASIPIIPVFDISRLVFFKTHVGYGKHLAKERERAIFFCSLNDDRIVSL
jgi:hypothetical protein